MALHSFLERLELKVGFLECEDPNAILQNASPFPVINLRNFHENLLSRTAARLRLAFVFTFLFLLRRRTYYLKTWWRPLSVKDRTSTRQTY